MDIEINSSGTKSSVIVFFIRVLIVLVVGICTTAAALGGYLLKTFLPMYIEEMDIKKRSLEPITATVISVDREFEKNNTKGYMKLSYEYNGNNYVYDLKYYEEGSFHHSTSGESEERPERGGDDRSSIEHWEELQAMVGTKQEFFVDPNEPDKVFRPISDDSIKVLKIIVTVGFALFAVVAVIIILAIILGKKIIKKSVHKVKEHIDTYSEK